MTPIDGYKQIGKHHPDCYAQHDKDGITFIVHRGNVWDLDRIGRRNGSTCWHRFACNDTKCRAEMLVRWDVLARCVNAGGPQLDLPAPS